MYKIFTAILLNTFLLSLLAQDYKHRFVHLGFSYPISTNWFAADKCLNHLSFNVFSGTSAVEQGFCFAGVYNNTVDYAQGFQVAGFLNTVKNKFTGFQISGFMGATGAFTGMQLAGFINMGKSFEGIQIAGFMNNNEEIKGLQISGFMSNLVYDAHAFQISGFLNKCNNFYGAQVGGFMNRCRDVEGFQVGGFLNHTSWVKGFQLSGFMNYSSNMNGFQLSGFLNNSEETKGCQLAGFMNTSEQLKGLQLAGFLNSSSDLTGTQVSGFINRANKVRGVQFAGFINFADSSDFPFALINIVNNGFMDLGLSYDELSTSLVTFRSGGKYGYGLLGLGYNNRLPDLGLAAEYGYGIRFPMNSKLNLSFEIAGINLWSIEQNQNDEYNRLTFRVLPVWELSERIKIFAGPTFNITWTNHDDALKLISNPLTENVSDDFTRQMYFSLIGGIRYHF